VPRLSGRSLEPGEDVSEGERLRAAGAFVIEKPFEDGRSRCERSLHSRRAGKEVFRSCS